MSTYYHVFLHPYYLEDTENIVRVLLFLCDDIYSKAVRIDFFLYIKSCQNLGTVVPLVFEKTPRSVYWKYENYTNSYHRGHRGRGRMVVGFTNYPISAYHH